MIATFDPARRRWADQTPPGVKAKENKLAACYVGMHRKSKVLFNVPQLSVNSIDLPRLLIE